MSYNLLIKSIRIVRHKGNDFLYKWGINPIRKKEGRRILVYHGVTKDARKDINARFISTHEFEQQLKYFKQHFNVVSLDDYIKGVEHPEKLTLSITFDDGYRNNLTEALPLLEKYNMPATFFITTIRQSGYSYLWADLLDLYRISGPTKLEFEGMSYTKKQNEYQSKNGSLKNHLKNSEWQSKQTIVDRILADNHFVGRKEFAPYLELLKEEEIKQLAASKWASIGSHGLYHNCLDRLKAHDAKEELALSKQYLEGLTQQEIHHFAYPDGRYNHQLIDWAEEIGYRHQLLVDYNNQTDSTDNRIHERFGINPYISLNYQLQCIYDGKY